MKGLVFSVLIIVTIFTFNNCTQKTSVIASEAGTEIQEQYDVPGVYVWEGKVDIGYGLEKTVTSTLSVFENGSAIQKEFTHESNETITIDLQWFQNKKGTICFGVFKTSNPDENTPGAQFTANPSKDGLIVGVKKNIYKKINNIR